MFTKKLSKILLPAIAGLALLTGCINEPPTAGPLSILLTNDDGYSAPGLQAMKGALEGAGHTVTIVAPLTNQSGVGSRLSTDVGGTVDVIEQAPGVWSVASSPADAVRAALDIVMKDNPPQLVISGANFGQNLAQSTTNQSGTVGAALEAMSRGIPSIAVSVGLDLSERNATPYPFPSTFAAFGPTGGFTATLIAHLQLSRLSNADPLLPTGTMLNVNVPVPYQDISDISITRLAQLSDLDFVWQDISGAVAAGGGNLLININLNSGPDSVSNSDREAHEAKQISITPIDGNMSGNGLDMATLQARLASLTP